MEYEQFGSIPGDVHRQEEYSLRDVLMILFRHRSKIATFFVGVFVTVTVATFLVPETFESEAKLLIRVGRESVSMDPSVLGPTISLAQDRENEINSELGILTSPFLAGVVVDEIGPDVILGRSQSNREPSPAVRVKAMDALLKNLDVSVEKRSHIISLTYQANDSQVAQLTLATLIDRYLERHIEVHRTQASPGFFEGQSAVLLDDLTSKEAELDRYRNDNAIASMDGQKELLLLEISGLQTNLDEANSQVESSQASIAALQNSLGSRSSISELSRVTGRANFAADEIKKRLIDLKLQEADMAARYPDDDRALVELRSQIGFATAELGKEQATRTEVTIGVDPNYQELQLDLIKERSLLYASMARVGSLREDLDSRRAELANLAARETGLARLERTVELADLGYREYVDHKQRANISAALDVSKVSNVSVVQPASLSFDPVRPRKVLNMVLGVFIGIFGGVGLAFFLEYFDDSLKSNEDVAKRLGLPVLASFSLEEYRSCI